MSNYEDDDLDDELQNEEQAPEEELSAPRSSGNRNFLVALGILGAVFILVTAALAFLYLSRSRGGAASDISATNVAIETANAQTVVAATLTSASRVGALATDTPQASATPALAKPSPTSVLAQPTATNTGAAPTPEQGKELASPTANAQTQTQSAPVVLTQSAQSTQTQQVVANLTATRQAAVNLTATATALPTTGFADDIGLPGLFGLALGMLLVILLVRRLRVTTSQ